MVDINPASVEQVLECLCGFAMRSYGQKCRSKYIICDSETITVECCYQLFGNLHIEHPVGQILQDCVTTFHKTHGCCVRTLLCLLLVWYRTHSVLSRQGCPSAEIFECFDELLSICISIIKKLSVAIRPILETAPSGDDSSRSETRLVEATTYDSSRDINQGVSASTESKSGNPNDHDSFDDIAWYFMPEGQDVHRKDMPQSIANDSSSSKISSKSVSSLPPHRLPSSTGNSAGNCCHSDDDDFADCFDSVEIAAPTNQPSVVDNIDWLNKALSSIRLTPIVPGNGGHVTQDTMKSNAYSRNLFDGNLNTSTSSITVTNEDVVVDPLEDCVGNLGSPQPSSDYAISCKRSVDLTPHTNLSVEDIVRGLSRSDTTISKLLNKVVKYGTLHGTELGPNSFKAINTVSCNGPSSSLSDVYVGMVVKCSYDVIGLLSSKQKYQTLLFQGDLHPDYTHLGYRNTVKHKKVIQVQEVISAANVEGWCEATLNRVIQSDVSCLLLKGACQTTLKNNLLSRGVIVLENVSYSLLSYISELSDVPIIHYADDINSTYCCELSVSILERRCAGGSHLVNIELTSHHVSNTMMTVVLCSPVMEESHLMEERFNHALSRLKSVITSGYCLVNVSIQDVISQLHRRAGLGSSDATLLPLAVEQFTQQLSSLIHCGDESSSPDVYADDLEAVISAWETSLSACKYFTSLGIMVRVGLEKAHT